MWAYLTNETKTGFSELGALSRALEIAVMSPQ